MRARAGILGLCACLLLPPSVSAQGLIGPRNAQAAVLVVDMKRIKSDTAAGRDMLAKTIEIRRRIQAGVAERGERLRAEEQRLAEERETLDPDDFREQVRAFEQQVFANRELSERETRRLQLVLSGASTLLKDRATVVFAAIMRERRADLLLDSSQIILSADRLDITDEVIERLDIVLPEMPIELVGPEPATQP